MSSCHVLTSSRPAQVSGYRRVGPPCKRPFLEVSRPGLQAAHQQQVRQDIQVARYGVAADPEAGGEWRGVKELPLPMRQHLPGKIGAHTKIGLPEALQQGRQVNKPTLRGLFENSQSARNSYMAPFGLPATFRLVEGQRSCLAFRFGSALVFHFLKRLAVPLEILNIVGVFPDVVGLQESIELVAGLKT